MSVETRKIAALLVISGFTLNSVAAERRISRAQLPEAVRRTADEQSRGATVKGYTTEVEHGQREYEVEMIINGHSKDVSIAADGQLIEIEEQVDLNELRARVASGLRASAGQGSITKVESITKNGAVVAYEAQVQTANKRSEIQVGPDGQALKHEE